MKITKTLSFDSITIKFDNSVEYRTFVDVIDRGASRIMDEHFRAALKPTDDEEIAEYSFCSQLIESFKNKQ